MTKFNRDIAFSRSLGLLTKSELKLLKNKTIAIAGLGGVGGSHVLTLARLGIGSIHIADMDTFELENFNRQAGANMNTIGRQKIEVLSEMAKAINPEIKIKAFPNGVTPENMREFFFGVDAYVDALDFFAFDIRGKVFDFCYENEIPATTAAPLGMGVALLKLIPGKMSFRDYFQWKKTDSDLDLGVKFLLGLTPKAPHKNYLVEPSAVDLANRKGPSTPMACELCAGVMGTEILKILLKRGKVLSAPHSIVFDAFENKIFHSRVLWGNKNPWQKIKIAFVKRKFAKIMKQPKLYESKVIETDDDESSPHEFIIKTPKELE